MYGSVAYPVCVEIGPDEVRKARLRAGYRTQQALADALDVSERLVQKWEKEGVGERYEHDVRTLLFPAAPPATLAGFSDFELLIELGRRLDRVARHEAEVLSQRAKEISQSPSIHAKPDSQTRAASGSGPRPRGNRDNDVPSTEDDS